MTWRPVLVALIVVATAAFVVGVTLERSEGDVHHAAVHHVEGAGAEGGGETPTEHATEAGGDQVVLGIDLEAVPFVIIAALTSLGLAAAVWLRPDAAALLAVVVVAMLVFTAFDIAEVVHQSDESRTGLAILAGAVAALHLSAGGVAAAMAVRPRAAAR